MQVRGGGGGAGAVILVLRGQNQVGVRLRVSIDKGRPLQRIRLSWGAWRCTDSEADPVEVGRG